MDRGAAAGGAGGRCDGCGNPPLPLPLPLAPKDEEKEEEEEPIPSIGRPPAPFPPVCIDIDIWMECALSISIRHYYRREGNTHTYLSQYIRRGTHARTPSRVLVVELQGLLPVLLHDLVDHVRRRVEEGAQPRRQRRPACVCRVVLGSIESADA